MVYDFPTIQRVFNANKLSSTEWTPVELVLINVIHLASNLYSKPEGAENIKKGTIMDSVRLDVSPTV